MENVLTRGGRADLRGLREVRPRLAELPALRLRVRERHRRVLFGKFSAKCCSFSAVSAPIFASKYAFCSIFQNLQDYLAHNFEIRQNFADFATFAKKLLNFHENC